MIVPGLDINYKILIIIYLSSDRYKKNLLVLNDGIYLYPSTSRHNLAVHNWNGLDRPGDDLGQKGHPHSTQAIQSRIPIRSLGQHKKNRVSCNSTDPCLKPSTKRDFLAKVVLWAFFFEKMAGILIVTFLYFTSFKTANCKMIEDMQWCIINLYSMYSDIAFFFWYMLYHWVP